MVSLGNWQGKAAQFVAKAPVDPSNITKASGPTKYEVIAVSYSQPNGQMWNGGMLPKGAKLSQTGTVRGTALFQVMDGEKLKVELFPGKTADQVTGFTSAAQTYER
jgi:hypothetical protein